MSRLYIFPLALVGLLAAVAGCTRGAENDGDAAERVVRIEAGESGFSPSNIKLQPDEPVVLEFLRTSEHTCATEVVFADSGIRHDLPLNTPVRVSVRPQEGQSFSFACDMDMHEGSFGVTAAGDAAQTPDAVAALQSDDGVINVRVDQQGFHPARIEIPAGEATVLRFTRVAEKGCNTGILIPECGVEKDFPLNEPVDVVVAPDTTGEFAFTCPMQMSEGVIAVTAEGSEQ